MHALLVENVVELVTHVFLVTVANVSGLW